jgi:hypothetical protein
MWTFIFQLSRHLACVFIGSKTGRPKLVTIELLLQQYYGDVNEHGAC